MGEATITAQPNFTRNRILAVVLASVVVGFGLAYLQPYLFPMLNNWTPDYRVYIDGARLVRAGQDPHALLPYWYPLPIVLFTTLLWSYFPYQYAVAFALIPVGLLILRYGRWAPLWLMFVPLAINVLYAQAEGWLILPIFWILEGQAILGSVGITALMFKPAYGILLVPYRIWRWFKQRNRLAFVWLFGLVILTFGVAFFVESNWPIQWFNGVTRRHNDAGLITRNMTVWAFFHPDRPLWSLAILALILSALIYLVYSLWRYERARGGVLLSLTLFFFPGGLNPSNSMMIIPLIKNPGEIVALSAVSWVTIILDNSTKGGFGGYHLIIVLAAMFLLLRRLRLEEAAVSSIPEVSDDESKNPIPF